MWSIPTKEQSHQNSEILSSATVQTEVGGLAKTTTTEPHFYAGSQDAAAVVPYTRNPSMWEADTHQEFGSPLRHMRPCLKTTITTKPNQKKIKAL